MGICKNQIYLSGLKKEVTTRWNVWSTCTKGVGSTDRKRQRTDWPVICLHLIIHPHFDIHPLTLSSTLSPRHPPSHLITHPLLIIHPHLVIHLLTSSSTLTSLCKAHSCLGVDTFPSQRTWTWDHRRSGKRRHNQTAGGQVSRLHRSWDHHQGKAAGDSICTATDLTPTTCCQDQNRWQHSCCRNRPDPYHLLSRSEQVTILWHKPRPCEPPPLHTVQNCPSRALHLSVAAWQQNILLQTCPWHDC